MHNCLNSLFDNIDIQGKAIIEYNKQHKNHYDPLYNRNLLDSREYINPEKITIANSLYNDNNPLSNFDPTIINKCLSIIELKKILLQFEFQHINNIHNVNNIDDFIHIADGYLSRYTRKIGGYIFEDNKWIAKKNEAGVIFINTIDSIDKYDMESSTFINRMIHILKNINNKYYITFDRKKEADGIYRFYIICKFRD